ncbi:MAG: 4Fe-4S dicluster domain-containing protein [Thermodesulfobacteriota bacterium]|nr:4Fe-4S dicluster domain-containing protein [Thermodesulfobacteriota bacterium]
MTRQEEAQSFAIAEEHCTGCRRCQLTCSMLFHDMFNPALAYIEVLQTTANGISFNVSRTDDCTECGSCIEACAFGCLT